MSTERSLLSPWCLPIIRTMFLVRLSNRSHAAVTFVFSFCKRAKNVWRCHTWKNYMAHRLESLSVKNCTSNLWILAYEALKWHLFHNWLAFCIHVVFFIVMPDASWLVQTINKPKNPFSSNSRQDECTRKLPFRTSHYTWHPLWHMGNFVFFECVLGPALASLSQVIFT